mgnify:CR=1 FL=1
MIEEYWIEYYDDRNYRHFTKYYVSQREVDQMAKNLEDQGYKDITIHKFRY